MILITISMISKVLTISTLLSRSFPTIQSFQLHSHSYLRSLQPSSTLLIQSTTRYMSSSDSNNMTKKRVLVPIAENSEEIETASITDTLTRFGAEVVVASVQPDGNLVCKMSRGIKFMADMTIAEASQHSWDLIALPGGMPGAEHLRDCPTLISLLQTQKSNHKPYAAICASPAVVLAPHGLLPDTNRGGKATCYPAPAFQEKLKEVMGEGPVVVDVEGQVITSQGPGTSLVFALQLGEVLYGREKADQVAKEMLVKR